MNKFALIALLSATMAVRINNEKSANGPLIGDKQIDPDVEDFYNKHMNSDKVAVIYNATANATSPAEVPAALFQGRNVSDVKMNGYVHDFVEKIVPATNTGRDESAPALNGPAPKEVPNAAPEPEVKKA